ncbi:unnamed protein product, partial [marine sediment metagenome]
VEVIIIADRYLMKVDTSILIEKELRKEFEIFDNELKDMINKIDDAEERTLSRLKQNEPNDPPIIKANNLKHIDKDKLLVERKILLTSKLALLVFPLNHNN